MNRVSCLIFVCLLSLGLATPARVLGCVNTSYSRTHEVQITDDLVKIIMGQFAEHGPVFYETELKRTAELLKKDAANVEARNDHAVALLKLKRFDEAEAEFLRIENEAPGLYKTHSNLGVLYKKTGEFAKAVEHNKRALKIQPEGHLGLGDYYLKMLDWRERNSDPDSEPMENFLGLSYFVGPPATVGDPNVNKEFLRTLIIADRHFADGYLVLGDVLFIEGNLELAFRCYKMAEALIYEGMKTVSPKSTRDSFLLSVISLRKRIIREEWKVRADEKSGYISSRQIYDRDFTRELKEANQWRDNFQKVEAEMLAAGTPVDFTSVKAEMAVRGISEPKYVESGVVQGKENRRQFSSMARLSETIILLCVISIVGIVVFAIVRALVRGLAKRRKLPGTT